MKKTLALTLLLAVCAPVPAAAEEAIDEFEIPLVSLDLKDADLTDVLRYFSAVAELNVIIDPSVSGLVTVRVDDLPWPDAMEIILRAHGLWYDLEGNVMLIGPLDQLLARLAAEAEMKRLREEAAPLHTVVFRINYADATQVASVVEQVALTSRGSLIVDQRTNSLIVTDVAHALPKAKVVVFYRDR